MRDLIGLLLIFTVCSNAQNYQVTFSITEESPEDTFVGNVSTSFQFLADIPPEEQGYIKYSFLQQSYIQTLLSLNENTGVLYTAVIIDRESRNICHSQTFCSLTFDIAVRSSRPQSSFFAIISVNLVIIDINDNAPLFPSDIVNLAISESTVIGTSFQIKSASDLDTGKFSVQEYEIREQDGDFGLDVVRKLDGSFTVKLVLNSPIDREMKDHYSVMVIAVDGGEPKKVGAVFINITVSDVNDNSPQFTQQSYDVTVRENITIGTTVLRVAAADADIGLNGRITYRFSQNQLDQRVNELFEMSPVSGEILLKNKLVYESGTYYKIIIEAADNGEQPHVTQALARVDVIDVGNNPPIMEINLLSPGNSRIKNMSESASPGTFVAHINVIDKDTGRNGEVECAISDYKFELQRMAGKGYKVVVADELDREKQDLHQILVSCHDFGSPSLSTSAGFMVSLADENDCAPEFTQPFFTGTVPENHDNFRTFAQIIAFDEDLDENGEVRYYIDKQSTHFKFVIDELSGSVRANQTFDRESTPEITFRVIARDRGIPSLSSMAIVKLTISDKNDNIPRVLQPTEFSVSENKNSDTLVQKLNASDLDEGQNAAVMFLMQEDYENEVPFVVFPDGVIKTNRQLDREQQSRYDFTVVVLDKGSPRLSSSANVTVFVTDQNDNAPTLKFPKARNKTVSVFSNIQIGNKVAQIEAEDLDEGLNSISSYEITSGNDENLFIVDSKRGGIYLTRQVNIKQNRTFRLKVAVKDGGTPPLKAESDLNIIIRSSNTTGLSVTENDSSNNTVIVIIVVILTIVLSLIMILVICFLRKFDQRNKARKHLKIVAPDEKYPACFLEDNSRYLDSSNGSHDHLTITYDPMSNITNTTKKKEVSFDIDDSNSHHDVREVNNSTMSTFSTPTLEIEKVCITYVLMLECDDFINTLPQDPDFNDREKYSI